MALDWSGVDIDGAINRAADATDRQLASQISSITRLTDEEVAELCPEPADAKALQNALEILGAATDYNSKVARIMNGGEKLVKMAIKLGAFAAKAVV